MKIWNESDREEVIEFIKTSLKTISTNSQIEKRSQTSESKPKKSKMSLSEAFLYESDEESDAAEEMNEYEKELDLYLKANFSNTESTDLLKFWLNYSNVIQTLRKWRKKY